MGKFTEGPWMVCGVAGGWDGVKPRNASTPICHLVENNPANAVLIAAAPDMLRTIKAVREGMVHDFHYVCQDGLVETCLCYKCQKIRLKAVVEAAEGKQQ